MFFSISPHSLSTSFTFYYVPGMLRRQVRKFCSSRNETPLSTWEEVERNRPRVPTLEGYRRPARAPQQQDIPREDFHRFMMGRAPKIPEQWRAFVGGFVLFSWCIGACAFTMYKLRPDDFEWLEEERNKAEAAKARIMKKMATTSDQQDTSH